MGGKQSNPAFDGRTRAYSSSDLPSGNSSGRERIAGFRYTNGPDGPRIRYTGGGPTSSGVSIPAGRRSGSHVLNQSLDGPDGEDQLPPEGNGLLIGSLPAHLSPHLLGGKRLKWIAWKNKFIPVTVLYHYNSLKSPGFLTVACLSTVNVRQSHFYVMWEAWLIFQV